MLGPLEFVVPSSASASAAKILLRPQFLAGVVTLAIGIFHARLHAFRNRRRYVKVDAHGMELVRPFFRKLSLPWADIHSVDAFKHTLLTDRLLIRTPRKAGQAVSISPASSIVSE